VLLPRRLRLRSSTTRVCHRPHPLPNCYLHSEWYRNFEPVTSGLVAVKLRHAPNSSLFSSGLALKLRKTAPAIPALRETGYGAPWKRQQTGKTDSATTTRQSWHPRHCEGQRAETAQRKAARSCNRLLGQPLASCVQYRHLDV
jgi:hypothetical protein